MTKRLNGIMHNLDVLFMWLCIRLRPGKIFLHMRQKLRIEYSTENTLLDCTHFASDLNAELLPSLGTRP